jgi:hypothetical protein
LGILGKETLAGAEAVANQRLRKDINIMSSNALTIPNNTNVANAATAPATQDQSMSRADFWSVIVTVAVGIALAILATISAQRGSVIWLAIAVGALGGLVHEIAQSGGKILFFERKLDGFYIGALAGAVLGAVAGLLAVRGAITNPAETPNITELFYEAFLAGMALKGITEAAGGQALPAGSDSVTPGQALAAEATLSALAQGGSGKPSMADLDKPLDPPPATLPADV